MSYGNYHPLPPKPPKEKYLYGLSLTEAGILLLGFLASEKMLSVIPKLPLKNFLLSRIHLLIPLGIAAFFAFGRHPVTDIPIGQEIINLIEFRIRNRILEYKRGG